MGFMYVPPILFSFTVHLMHCFSASSIVCSCVVLGISISLLLAERSSMDSDATSPPDSANKLRQPPGPNPNPTPRDVFGPFYPDSDDFQPSEILAMVSSALNLLVATTL